MDSYLFKKKKERKSGDKRYRLEVVCQNSM